MNEMDLTPLISIIVPVWNVELYLSECVESILSQTYTNIELILIDDGSTDGSGIICDKYKLEDNRVKVYHCENSGVSHARNYGVEMANGQWISFVDSDDWLEKSFIEKIIEEGNYKNGDVYISGGHFKEYENKTIEWKCFTNKVITDEDEKELLVAKMLAPLSVRINGCKTAPLGEPWAKLYKKEFLLASGIRFDEKFHPYEDVLFHYEIFRKASAIVGSDIIGYHYRYTDGSSTNRYKPQYVKMMNDFILRTKSMIDICKNRDLLQEALNARIIMISGWLCRVCFFNESRNEKYEVLQKELQKWKEYALVNDAILSSNKFLSIKQRLLQLLLREDNNWLLYILYRIKIKQYKARIFRASE